MQDTYTIRLTALAVMTGTNRDKIRNMQNLDQMPWNEPDRAPGKNRAYGTRHALGLLIAESLTAQGLTNTEAGEAVRMHETAIELFLDDVDAGGTPAPRMVAMTKNLWRFPDTGESWVPTWIAGTGTPEEVARVVQDEVHRAGRGVKVQDKWEWHLQGPFLASQSINASYDELKARAVRLGFVLGGRTLVAPDYTRGRA